MIYFIVLQAITWFGVFCTLAILLLVLPGFVIPDPKWVAIGANEIVLLGITYAQWKKWYQQGGV